MTEKLYQLDPSIEVLNDDMGRIILLPSDRRNPLRLESQYTDIIELIKNGINDEFIQTIKDGVKEGSNFAMQFRSIYANLESNEMLNNARTNHARGLYHSPVITKFFDTLAKTVTYPFTVLMSSTSIALLLMMIYIITIGLHVFFWIKYQGLLFTSVANPHWWVAIIVLLTIYPVLHEFGHALVARLFGFQVTTVGLDYQSIRSYRPFVEVKRLMLVSKSKPKIWVPLAGVLANLLLALLSIIMHHQFPDESFLSSVSGVLVLFLYWRILIDAGLRKSTDASKALNAAKEFSSDKYKLFWEILIRGTFFLFLVATIVMLFLSLGHYMTELIP